MLIKKKKGQSTVEYIVLVTAVIVVTVVFIFNPNSIFRQRINTTYDSVTNAMTNMAARTSTVFTPSPLAN